MQRGIIESSFIKAVGHESGILEVEFRDGKLFRYKDVPHSVFQEFLSAKSAGEFFNRNILHKYEEEEISS
jgi:hypothetical protein